MGLEATIFILISRLFQIYYFLIIARIIFSWIQINLTGAWKEVYKFIYALTEPYLALFRNIIPPVRLGGMGLDLSPIIALFVLGFIQRIVFFILELILGAV